MLQSDFDLLCDWVRIWQMPFNPDEYEVMRVTHHRDSSILSYNMFGKFLKVSKNFKDLCVIMCYDLKWSEQVNTFVNKANRVLGFIERTVGCTSTVVFAKLYVTLVQPILENACPVWSPYLLKKKALESIQKRTSRLALSQKRGEMPYEQRCKLLKWDSLEKRRIYLSLVECYKTIHNLNGISFEIVFEVKPLKRTRANHKYILPPKLPKIDCYKYSFAPLLLRKNC